jgi:GNAT superfamily N-acetyltransferase
VYARNRFWVPPLLTEQRRFFDPAHNPFFRHADVHLFIARRGSHDAGRIAVYVNHAYNRFHQDQVGFFGFFEAQPDEQVAAVLLSCAEDWLRARRMRAIVGPANFATDNDCGLLLDAYDRPPVLMTAYTPPYYRELVEVLGYVKSTDWYAYRISRSTLQGATGVQHPRLHRLADAAERRSRLTLRTVDMQHFDQELARVQQVYNGAWQANRDFVPLDDAETAYLARSLRHVIDPELVFIAEDGGRPAGVSISLPDYNQLLRRLDGRLLPFGWWHLLTGRTRIDALRVFAMGVLPPYRRRGVEALFYARTLEAAARKGYRWAELSLIAENNTLMRHNAEAFGARRYKTYRVYQKAL